MSQHDLDLSLVLLGALSGHDWISEEDTIGDSFSLLSHTVSSIGKGGSFSQHR